MSENPKLKLGVAGATGAVGRIVCEKLDQSPIIAEKPIDIRLLASSRSVGQQIDVMGKPRTVQELGLKSVADLDLLIASLPDDISLEVGQWCRNCGTIMIDESAAHRMNDDVPLVIPEVNPQALDGHQGLIASPNCSTIQMVMCLKPLQSLAGISRCLLYTSPSPRDRTRSRMPSSA